MCTTKDNMCYSFYSLYPLFTLLQFSISSQWEGFCWSWMCRGGMVNIWVKNAKVKAARKHDTWKNTKVGIRDERAHAFRMLMHLSVLFWVQELKAKYSFYLLCFSPRNFWKHLHTCKAVYHWIAIPKLSWFVLFGIFKYNYEPSQPS